MKLIQEDNFEPISFVCETREEAKLMIEMFRSVDYLDRAGQINLSPELKAFIEDFFSQDHDIN